MWIKMDLYTAFLNLISLGWVISTVMEWIPVIVGGLVGLSVVFLNVSKGLKEQGYAFFKRKKKEQDEEIHK